MCYHLNHCTCASFDSVIPETQGFFVFDVSTQSGITLLNTQLLVSELAIPDTQDLTTLEASMQSGTAIAPTQIEASVTSITETEVLSVEHLPMQFHTTSSNTNPTENETTLSSPLEVTNQPNPGTVLLNISELGSDVMMMRQHLTLRQIYLQMQIRLRSMIK